MPLHPVLWQLNLVRYCVHTYVSASHSQYFSQCYFPLVVMQWCNMDLWRPASKIAAHLVYKVVEPSHLLVLAWQHAGGSGCHLLFSFSLSSQLYMQEVFHMPVNISTMYKYVCVCAHMCTGKIDTALGKHTHVCTKVIIFHKISLLAIHFNTLNMASIQLFCLCGWSQQHKPSFYTSETVTYMHEDIR